MGSNPTPAVVPVTSYPGRSIGFPPGRLVPVPDSIEGVVAYWLILAVSAGAR